eukprot:symbB.v1.2.002151.t1/scaffold116.1/size325063/8
MDEQRHFQTQTHSEPLICVSHCGKFEMASPSDKKEASASSPGLPFFLLSAALLPISIWRPPAIDGEQGM